MLVSGVCMQAKLECSTKIHLSQSHKQLRSLKPCTLIYSSGTCRRIKPISCTHRKREIRSTVEDATCSSNVDASISLSKHYEKNDGILIVDHGSRRPQSNAMIHTFVDMFKLQTGHANVEPAHMELASPTIKEAFDKCVCHGASRVIIAPYFLSPGRHWEKDIPALAAEAAKGHKNVSYIVTAPIGLHDLMVDILQDRINRCLSQATGEMPECDICAGTGRCKIIQSLAFSEIEESVLPGKKA